MNRSPQKVLSPIALFWIVLIYFFSGLCSLIDEVVWVRLIKLSLGNTVYASSIVVSVFMGGLALGALFMGRIAGRVPRPLRTYALLELGAALLALSVPFVLKLADAGYGFIFRGLGPSSMVLMPLQVFLSILVVLAPALVMGSTLPLLGMFIARAGSSAGSRVGVLYAANTMGAALGCYLAGFVLLRLAGVMGTLYIAAAVNLLVAAGGWLLSLKFDEDVMPDRDEHQISRATKLFVLPIPGKRSFLNEIAVDSADSQTGRGADIHPGFLLACFFASGFISIGYELVWMRSIVIPMGGYTYVFASVLTVYLAGNMIGAWMGSLLSKLISNPSVWFGLCLAVLGVCGVFYIPWFVRWFGMRQEIAAMFGALAADPAFSHTTLRLAESSVLFLFSSIVMGAGFPLALQSWNTRWSGVGAAVGLVYGANTIGAVAGGIAAGFLLIPYMGIHFSMVSLGLAGIWMGAVLAAAAVSKFKTLFRPALAGAAAIATAAAFMLPSHILEENLLDQPGKRLLSVMEGPTATVSVTQDLKGYRELGVDGVYMAGDGDHRCAQKTLGHLGCLLNKNARDVLSIGFGSGETSLCLSLHHPRSLEVVEIAPEVTRSALEFFPKINLGRRLSEKVFIRHMDAKNFLRHTGSKYDLIINDSDIHQSAGSAPLYTLEHFTCARDHLNPGGLFITKLHILNQSESVVRSILATFLKAFPHASIWFPATRPYIFFYLAGSREPLQFSPRHIDREIARPEVGGSLEYLNIGSSTDLSAWYIGDEKDLARYVKSGSINSDMFPFVEFNAQARAPYYAPLIRAVRSQSLLDHMDWEGVGEQEKGRWLERFKYMYNGASHFLSTQHGYQRDFFAILNSYSFSLVFMPGQKGFAEGAVRFLDNVKFDISRGGLNCAAMVARLEALPPEQQNLSTALMLRSWLLMKQDKTMEAMEAAILAVSRKPETPDAFLNLGRFLLEFGLNDSALSNFDRALAMDPLNADLNFDLGIAYADAGMLEKAVPCFEEVLQIRPDDVYAHCSLGQVYGALGRTKEAAEIFRKALAVFPGFPQAEEGLKAALDFPPTDL